MHITFMYMTCTCMYSTVHTITMHNVQYYNVHPKRPWMCFSDKYYRRKVDWLDRKVLRDPAVPRLYFVRTVFTVHMCTWYVYVNHNNSYFQTIFIAH